jgi:CDP-diacylglycerol--glycerol-3-phosphate 3-phosphatidyltransferase
MTFQGAYAMNLANKITLARIALTFIFMVFLFSQGLIYKVCALITFIIASWTDVLDGYLAKKRNEVSDFGKFMDPIADKVLVIAAFLAFVEMKLIPAWIVVIIVLREFIVTGLRLFALTKGEVIEAEMAGKHKTVSQMVSIYVILISVLLRTVGTLPGGFWGDQPDRIMKNVIFCIMLVTAALTLISGVSFLVKYKKLFAHAEDT